MVDSFNFAYTTGVTADVRLGETDCVGFTQSGGNHDVTFGHAITFGHCDMSGNKICYLNMSQVLMNMIDAGYGNIQIGSNLVGFHCHRHESQNMVGVIELIVSN